MTSNVSIRSNVVLAITQQKFSCFRRDQLALNSCLESIAVQCDKIDSSRSDVDVCVLRIKALSLSELRLANQGDILRSVAGAVTFLKLGDANKDLLLKEDVKAWNARLDQVVKTLRGRVDHGIVFAEVLQEWLVEKHTAVSPKGHPDSDASRPSSTSDAPSLTRAPLPTTFVPIDFLKSHNASEALLDEFAALSKSTRKYGLETLGSNCTVHPYDVKQAIEAVASDARLNSPEVRAQLTELSNLPDVLKEMAEAFTISRRHLTEWEWSPAGIRSDLQKHLSGKKRAFLNIEISETIYLETIAQQWSRHFREGFMKIRTSSHWPGERPLRDLQTGNEKRLESMLEMLESSRDEEPQLLIEKKGLGVAEAAAEQSLRGFMFALRSGSYAQYTDTDTDQNQKPKQNQNGTRDRRGTAGQGNGDGWGGVIDASRTAVSFSDVFRDLRADIALTRTIAPTKDIVVLHSDLEDFGPSVPHEITLGVLRFFGMSEGWLSWFEKYLRIPQLDPSSRLTTAIIGTPFGLSISLLVNELLLVLLDCALAADTGIVMNRRHDDFWVWSTTVDQVERAWSIMNEFTAQTGLSWNESKTGCVTVRGPASAGTTSDETTSSTVSSLPTKPLKWGLLQLNNDGQWSVDETDLENLAASMRDELQTSSTKSFLSRINLWNKYHGYIARNVGPITRENWSVQIPTLTSILRKFQHLVIGSSSTLNDTLVDYFHERFPIRSEYSLNNAILSWPIQLGGFQLHPHAIRTMVCSQQMASAQAVVSSLIFTDQLAESKRAYERYRLAWISEWGHRAWDRRRQDGISRITWGTIVDRPDPVSESDFVRWHALQTLGWRFEYDRMSVPLDVSPGEIAEMVDSVYGLLARSGSGDTDKGLVDKKLVPTHVAAEIDAAAREMFASLAP